VSARGRIARTAAAAVAAALTAAVGPPAAHAKPTLAVDQRCYAPGDVMDVSGAGYTPGGTVNLSFTGAGVGLNELQADLTGGLRAGFDVRPEDLEAFLSPDEVRREIVLAAVDAAQAQADPAAATASVTFLLTRFGVASNQDDQAMQPRRRLALQVAGFTTEEGRRLYLHYVRGERRVATVSLGRLTGPCGTLRKTLPRAFPMRRVQAGTWRLAFSLSRTDPTAAPGFSHDVRVRRRDAVAG
jgi:hypothetical protein